MKDHFALNTRSNIIRQAIFDSALGEHSTIKGLLDYQIEKGASIKRLANFAHRRLKIDKETALVCILLLTDTLH